MIFWLYEEVKSISIQWKLYFEFWILTFSKSCDTWYHILFSFMMLGIHVITRINKGFTYIYSAFHFYYDIQ